MPGFTRKIGIVAKWSNEETDEPLIADHRNFYKVDLWTKDGQRIERMLFAGSSLDKARAIFADFARKRPRVRLTIRQANAHASTVARGIGSPTSPAPCYSGEPGRSAENERTTIKRVVINRNNAPTI